MRAITKKPIGRTRKGEYEKGRGEQKSLRPFLRVKKLARVPEADPYCKRFYAFLKNFFLPKPARPIRPVPKRSMVAGSGTASPTTGS